MEMFSRIEIDIRYIVPKGWEEGRGLGKDQQGITSHIRVKTRKDNAGSFSRSSEIILEQCMVCTCSMKRSVVIAVVIINHSESISSSQIHDLDFQVMCSYLKLNLPSPLGLVLIYRTP